MRFAPLKSMHWITYSSQSIRNGYKKLCNAPANRSATSALTSEIEWVSSEGNYVQLHSKGKSHLLRETMDGLEAKLDPREFIRIRRSTIVRTDVVKELQPLFNSEYALVLKDGTKLQSSRRYRKNLDALLKV